MPSVDMMPMLEKSRGKVRCTSRSRSPEPLTAHGAGIGPDLEDVVVLDVGDSPLSRPPTYPRSTAGRFPSHSGRWAVRALVVFALVPDDAANAVRQPGLLHAPEHAAVDRCSDRVGFADFGWCWSMRVPPTAAVDDADRHLLVFHQALGKFHAPIADSALSPVRPSRPALHQRFGRATVPAATVATHSSVAGAAIAADPFAGVTRRSSPVSVATALDWP